MTEAAPPPRKIKLVMGTSGPRIWWEDGAHIGENWKDQPVHEYVLVEARSAMSDLAELLAKIDRECAEHEAKFPTLSLATLFYVRDIRALLQHIAAEPTRIRAAVEAEKARLAQAFNVYAVGLGMDVSAHGAGVVDQAAESAFGRDAYAAAKYPAEASAIRRGE